MIDSYIYERTFIGACILASTKHLEVDLSPHDFASEQMSRIWEHMREQRCIDVTELATSFGEKLISDMLENSHVGNIQKVAANIREAAHRRRLIMVLAKSASELEHTNVKISEIANMVTQSLEQSVDVKGSKVLHAVLTETYKDLEHAHLNGVNINFTKTGLAAFDNALGGLQNEGLIIIAGRPSMGKTAFATKIARNIGEEKPVLVISMEMTAKQLAMRYMAAEMNIDLQVMMQGRLPSSVWSQLAGAVDKLADSKIEINDMSKRDINDICAEARRFKRTHKAVGAIIVDYLGLMDMPDAQSKAEAVGSISRQFKVLAGEIGCPVILLSQLNRELEKRANKAPQMSDLRDSGAIEQDADQIIFPFRPEVYSDDPTLKGIAEIRMAKNRNGRTGKVVMNWVAESASFVDRKNEEWE